MISVRLCESSDRVEWDRYVYNHPYSVLYHLSGWKNIIEKTYSHNSYYLVAEKNREQGCKKIVGILPLVNLKHFLFGNSLISIPFFDMGGLLADNGGAEKALLKEAIKLGETLKADIIELRHTELLADFNLDSIKPSTHNSHLATRNISFSTHSHKVRMLLDLPESSKVLMKSFKAKLRSQIKKPLKEGLITTIGGIELLDDFFKVFSINMRDLGSPVHSKKLIKNVLDEFSDKAKIVMVYKESEPVGCSVVVGFRDTLENPWASALRVYSRLSPNMLLYWSMLEYASDNGFKYFDFGRSSPDEGTYKFKKQWDAKPEPLRWQYLFLNPRRVAVTSFDKSKFDNAVRYWQKLPVPIATIVGPIIRKHIGL